MKEKRRVICTEDRQCFIEPPKKMSQVGGQIDTNDLIPFPSGTGIVTKRRKPRNKSQIGRGRPGRRKKAVTRTTRTTKPAPKKKGKRRTPKRKSSKRKGIRRPQTCTCRKIKRKTRKTVKKRARK